MKPCKACAVRIAFVPAFTSGKIMPLQLDEQGEWSIDEKGFARHIGKPSAQLELGAKPGPQRWSSHFATCPNAAEFRSGR